MCTFKVIFVFHYLSQGGYVMAGVRVRVKGSKSSIPSFGSILFQFLWLQTVTTV